jgi:hypothetical protein
MDNYLYTELDNITEKEFFNRELGLQTKTVKSIDEIKQNGLLLISSNNPEFWKPLLNTLKKESCIFFLIGNETYEPNIYNSLNNVASIKHVFVYNPPTKINKRTLLKTLLGNLIDSYGFTEKSDETSYRDLRNSIYLMKKFRRINISYPYSRLPQGYSNNFAFKLSQRLDLTNTESLISEKVLSFAKQVEQRSKFISFSGQPTNRKRKMMLFWSRKYMDEIPDITEGFRGLGTVGDFTYLDQLMHSKFILVPPGSFNNSNHRYTESLICGAIPLILAKNSIDPSENSNWTNSIKGIKAYSAKLLLRFASNLNDQELNSLLVVTRKNDFKGIKNFTETFSKVVSLP